MAGKNCPWCGRANTAEAERCYACGTPLTGHEEFGDAERAHASKPRGGRRRVLYVALGIIVIAAAGVGVWLGTSDTEKPVESAAAGSPDVADTTPSTKATNDTTSTTQEFSDPTPPAVAFGEAVAFWGTAMTVSPPQMLVDADLEALVGVDVDLYVVSVTIENTGDEARDYNLFYWEAVDGDDAIYDASLYVEQEALDTGDVLPGEKVSGLVGFELPRGKTIVSVTYSPILADQTVTWRQ